MSKEYIEKEAFIALLNKRIYCLCGGETVKETRNIRDMLEVFPPADVKPVVKGEWIVHIYKLGMDRYECSACHERNDREKNFCPNCGAEMREDEDDE